MVLIKGEKFIKAFPTMEDAIEYAREHYGLQSVLIREVDRSRNALSIPALSMGILRGRS